MKIVSFNVNGIRACLKKGLLDFMNSTQADVYCFQETKAYSNQIQFDGLEDWPYWTWIGAEKPGYSGCATFSNEDFLSVRNGIGVDRFDQEGRFNICEFDDFYLYNIYFPNGGMGEQRHLYKMDFLESLLQHLDGISDKPLIITGDYNIAHTEHDIHDPIRLDGESGFKPEERAWMDQLCNAGFHDCYRLKHPQERDVYSWWSYRIRARERNKGWRIDYFFVSDRLVDRVKECSYLTEVPGSDHCPVLLELI